MVYSGVSLSCHRSFGRRAANDDTSQRARFDKSHRNTCFTAFSKHCVQAGRQHRHGCRDASAHAVSQPAPGLPGQASEFQQEPATAAWLGGLLRTFAISATEYDAYVSMARPVNVVPSFLLVVVGALCATRHCGALLNPTVWAMAFVSCGIAVSSVVVNDYFDFRLGVDTVNAPEKPLPSGKITPDGALLFASCIYIAVLIVACTLPDTILRLIIAISAAATLAYTPILKRMTAMKNLTVAFIIAASPLSGALATGLAAEAWTRVLPLSAFLFGGVCFREMLMDINDRAGDEVAGLRTVPIVLGTRAALAVATACMMCGVAAGTAAIVASCASSTSTLAISARAAAAVAFVVGTIAHVARDVRNIMRSEFDQNMVSDAIQGSFSPIGWGMILLAIFL